MSFQPGFGLIREGKQDVVCPRCGYRYEDSWELFIDVHPQTVDIDCEGCGRRFHARAEYVVEYTSWVNEQES